MASPNFFAMDVSAARSAYRIGVKPDDIKATFKDGIPEVTMPKTEEAKAKKIAITAGS